MASIILQNDPQHFTDADKFVPERWLRENANKLPNPFIHLPFGFGPRSCIGRRFAELELEVILARYSFAVTICDISKVRKHSKILFNFFFRF